MYRRLVSRPLNRLSRDTFLRGRARPPITTNETVNIVHQRITEFRSRKLGSVNEYVFNVSTFHYRQTLRRSSGTRRRHVLPLK